MKLPSFSDSIHFVKNSLSTAKSSIVPAGKYLGNVFHKTVVSLTHSVNTLTGRVSPAPLNLPCIKKSSELIEKLQILVDDQKTDEIPNWVAECGSFFDLSSIALLSENRLLQFTSLLATFKDLPELQIYREQLPDHAKSYLQILISNDSSESKAKDVKTLFSKNKNILMAGLAHLINHEKMNLKDLLTTGILKKNQLLTLAPFLHYVNLKGIYEANDPTFEISFLEKCPNLKVLLIQNPKITTLPALALCQELDCSNCLKLELLPALPFCQKLYCPGCTGLEALPALPLCEELDCSDSKNLRALPELPFCQKLNCSGCTGLQALPALPLCQNLNCSYCTSLQALPLLPLCKEFNCSNCPLLETLPALPLCQKLDCSHCLRLQTLPALPFCQKLDCSHCTNLQTLPALLFCRELKCSNCLELEAIPPLPLCQKLNCWYCRRLPALPLLPLCHELICGLCTALQTLPVLPLCQKLNCSECTNLQALPALPLCQKLDCYKCNSLQALPALPICHELDCSNCIELELLPALPFCEELDCLNCTGLHVLPALPLCQKLNCSHCTSLQALPALPNCRRLEHEGCLNLPGLPELPFNAQVSGNNGFAKLKVEIKHFDQNPVLLLEKLSHYLLQNQPFPNVYYFVEGQLSEAIDVGGVRRDFIARLFERLFAKKNEDSIILPISNEQEKGVWPLSNDSEEMKIAYRTIGRIFTLCYLGTSDFKVGEVFDPLFFTLLQTDPSSEEFWIRNLLLVKGLPETMSQLTSPEVPSLVFDKETLMKANILLDAEEEVNFSTVAAREQLREKMLSEAKDDTRLKAVFTVAGELKIKLGPNGWNTFCLEEAEAVRKKIQGEVSVPALKNKLKFELRGGVQPAAFNRVKGFLLDWIDRQDKHSLSTFIRAVTSNPTVGSHDIQIEVYDRDPDLLPVAHTCFFTLELSANCPTQEAFDNKLNLLLTEGLAGSGFQVA